MKRFTYFFMFIFSLVSSSLVSMQINDDAKIVIKTIDAVEHEVSYGIIKECETINHLIEDTGQHICIPVPNVTSENFNHIIKIIHYSKLEVCSKTCVANYIKENILQRESIVQNNLVSLFAVANYLDCKVVMNALFDCVVDYFNDEKILSLFEENPYHKIFTSLSKNLLIQKILINQNRLYEWLLTMYEYDGGFKCDQKQFAVNLDTSWKCPLRLWNWHEDLQTLGISMIPNPLCVQLVAPHGTFVLKFFSGGYDISRVDSLSLYDVVPHMSTFFPDGNGCIVINNNAEGDSKAYYHTKLSLVEINLPGITTCIHACNNAVARGTMNSIEVYDQSLQTLLYTLDCDKQASTSVALSPDGDCVAYVVGNTLYIYSSKLSQTMSFSYKQEEGPIKRLVFNEDGTLLSFSFGFKICTKTIDESRLSNEKKKLVSNKEFLSKYLDKIPESITYVPGTNLLAFSVDQTLYVFNPCTQKTIFQKRMNGFITNIFFNKKKDTLFFLEELHTKTKEGVYFKKIDIEFLRALDGSLSIQQVMLLKLIQDKIYKDLKLDLGDKKNHGLKKIFDSLPVAFQTLLSTRVKLSYLDSVMLKTKLFCSKVSQLFKKKNNK